MANVTISKDKNMILMQLEDKATPYKIDINTGIIYGLRGSAIQRLPFDCFKALIHSDTNIGKTLHRLIDNKYILTSKRAVEQLKIADSLDNLGIILTDSYEYYAYAELTDKQTFKEFVEFAKSRISQNLDYSYSDFQTYKQGLQLNKLFNTEFDLDDLPYIIRHTEGMEKWATPRQFKCFKVNFIDTRYIFNDFVAYGFARKFRDYCDWCKFLNEKVTTKQNYFSEYDRIRKAYCRQKEEIDARMFQQAIDMHRAEMEFEYGNYKIVIPTCPQDIKDEGKNMHHCVGGYAKSCLELDYPNRSYIVFVRHKDTPDKCYITCEIRNGRINQYFLSHDRYISKDEDKEFKEKYQEHLDECWIVEQ